MTIEEYSRLTNEPLIIVHDNYRCPYYNFTPEMHEMIGNIYLTTKNWKKGKVGGVCPFIAIRIKDDISPYIFHPFWVQIASAISYNLMLLKNDNK